MNFQMMGVLIELFTFESFVLRKSEMRLETLWRPFDRELSESYRVGLKMFFQTWSSSEALATDIALELLLEIAVGNLQMIIRIHFNSTDGASVLGWLENGATECRYKPHGSHGGAPEDDS